jgi:segregation and condensation protein A
MLPAETGFESSPDAYAVSVAAFQGPLDLLIHLIKKNEVNIYDIPIALITAQYLAYIDVMEELDLDIVGEFLVMAATLIHIKSRMLLPRPDPLQEDDEEDPRKVLVDRLLEYQKYKTAANLLHERETVRSAQWLRPGHSIADVAGEDVEPELEIDLFSLMAAFKAVLDRGVRVRRLVPGCVVPVGTGRHLSRVARNDPPSPGAGLPGRHVRRDSGIQEEHRLEVWNEPCRTT